MGGLDRQAKVDVPPGLEEGGHIDSGAVRGHFALRAGVFVMCNNPRLRNYSAAGVGHSAG